MVHLNDEAALLPTSRQVTGGKGSHNLFPFVNLAEVKPACTNGS